MSGRRIFARTSVIAVLLGCLNVPCLFASKKQSNPSDPIDRVLSQGVNKIPTNGKPGVPRLQRRNPRYRVESGDVMIINFPYTPKFDQTVTVNPDGFITLQDAGGIHVGGKTLPQIKGRVKKAYAKILRNPEVSINLKKFEKPYFLALGQVHHPGKYDLEGYTTVAEAIAMAGGFTGKAKHNDVLLFRRISNNWASATKVNLKHMLRSGNLSEDLRLQSGDMVYVPQNTISKVKPFLPWPSLSYYIR